MTTSDATLDLDLARWYTRDNSPRVQMMGPVVVRAFGPLLAQNPQTPRLTELAVFLACHRNGVEPNELHRAMFARNSSDIAERTTLAQLRRWLGADRNYLPKPDTAPARYSLNGVLVDADIFDRLRLRGLGRGSAGIDDLWAALRLVTGEPFSGLRPAGYDWLAETQLDSIYAARVVDVAHVAASQHLAAGEMFEAADAAQRGLVVGESPPLLLDLLAAHDALGQSVAARAVVARLLASYDTTHESS